MLQEVSVRQTDDVEIRRTIVAFLAARVPNLRSGTLDDDTPLLSSGALDSIGVLDLMMFLDERFAIGLDDADFDADNLETIGRLIRFVERKRNA